jgi:hypothetical protein
MFVYTQDDIYPFSLIYQPPNAHQCVDFGDFAKQCNGGTGYEKDL